MIAISLGAPSKKMKIRLRIGNENRVVIKFHVTQTMHVETDVIVCYASVYM